MKQLNILVACEESGAVRDAFIALGHNAVSCDLLPSSSGNNNPHIQGDAIQAMSSRKWDLIIAFPPCTYLCSSGLHWNTKRPERAKQTDEAFEFFMQFANADCEHIAIENPIGCVSSRWRKPDQIIQPYWFGDHAQKSTCLWLKGLPCLSPTDIVSEGEFFEFTTKHGVKKRQPMWYYLALKSAKTKEERSTIRSKTFRGIANAMASQWSEYLTNLPTEQL